MIHNIGQISHQFTLFQQQAFKLCQSKANMSSKKLPEKDKNPEGKEYPSSPWQGPLPFPAAWRPYLEEQNYPAPKLRLGPPEV
jgi:hypothetical protein